MGKLRIIDFGTASKYLCSDGSHVKESTYTPFRGNYLLNSSHVLANKPPTRRDDMISIGLIMIFLTHELPYQGLYLQLYRNRSDTIKEKLREAKENCTPEQYCNNMKTQCFLNYMKAVMALEYKEEPFYD